MSDFDSVKHYAISEMEQLIFPKPYIGMRFFVEMDHTLISAFTECSGLSIETELFEYKEGGLNTYTHKLPVRTSYGNVRLKRGLDAAQDLYRWYMRAQEGKAQRKNISIIIYDKFLFGVRRWDLKEAFPVKWTGPDLNVHQDAVAVEEIEFAHHGLVPDTTMSKILRVAKQQVGNYAPNASLPDSPF